MWMLLSQLSQLIVIQISFLFQEKSEEPFLLLNSVTAVLSSVRSKAATFIYGKLNKINFSPHVFSST